MKLSPVSYKGQIIGFELKSHHSHFFFGTRHADLSLLAQFYPQYQFSYLKQVHKTRVLNADEPFQGEIEADGQYCTETHIALCVQTADCLPVLISNGSTALALHAGWRGVAQNIVQKGFQSVAHLKVPDIPKWLAVIGPHIQKEHFEVDTNVADVLRKAFLLQTQTGSHQAQSSEPPISSGAWPNKAHVDLKAITRLQLQNQGVTQSSIVASQLNTHSSKLFHSYRRDQLTGNRQYSFVALLSS